MGFVPVYNYHADIFDPVFIIQLFSYRSIEKQAFYCNVQSVDEDLSNPYRLSAEGYW